MLTIVASCAKIDAAKYGKVSLYKSTSKSPTFLFKVEESYVAKTIDSSKDDDHPLLSEAQANLLNQILINQKLCLDEYNYPKFTITSKQQRIYDVTFANLIDQSYNAKPVTPLTFFGKCVK
tara:strand:+ start:2578 stop:2940 length:363 start_codon:yes stop_codon:yes gene_type:complete